MVQLNLALREINCKVVFFGCGLGGKTTNLEIIHKRAAKDSRGELTSIATESDRTLFFDFMPLDLGTVSGMRVKFQLYTVPGQVYYNSTRKLVLRGADGVIFVADSHPSKLSENIESLDNLEECLKEQGRSLQEMPHIIQFNKRDLPEVLTVEELAKSLNRHGAPCFEAVAARGDGVLETFKSLAGILLERVKNMSTESAAKPTVQAHRMAATTSNTPSSDRFKSSSDLQKLQGGIAGSTPPKPIAPVRVEQKVLDRKTPVASNAPEPLPVPTAKAMASVATTPSARAVGSQSFQDRVAHAAQISKSDARRPATASMMISTSGHRRKSSNAGLIIGVVAVLIAAAGAAYWFLLK